MQIVKDVMVTNVVSISPFARLRDALALMKQHRIKSLVVERNSPHDAWGIITYSNILKTVFAEEGDIDLLNVYDVCVKPVITVGEDLAVKHVATLMTKSDVKRLLVLSNNELIGIITMNDIMETLLEQIE
ncbi:CBS domain-containing protein [Oceanospirillum linum]|uniref:Histidine kinase n=1 Tax=Oceanospirillum linum TaxID=966 RepID=A0A1T1HG03_OCELI|nr:CBS domain-containing protein [Oceanospirillum linum]OOV88784.1 histidine kinase [Oceanospirillum linum]SEG00040.1 CBS domain-containing protein [Oleiphilus messinensis]SMP22307.1 CBS domain-containing protein [Oceanospirillum linum]